MFTTNETSRVYYQIEAMEQGYYINPWTAEEVELYGIDAIFNGESDTGMSGTDSEKLARFDTLSEADRAFKCYRDSRNFNFCVGGNDQLGRKRVVWYDLELYEITEDEDGDVDTEELIKSEKITPTYDELVRAGIING